MPRRKRRSRGLSGLDGMSKQHYVEVARILRDAKIDGGERCRMAGEFSKLAASDNPRFDTARFGKAAGCG